MSVLGGWFPTFRNGESFTVSTSPSVSFDDFKKASVMTPTIPPFDPAPAPALETTWSNEKIVAYRTVEVVEDDGMWLGHYHPDGASVTTARHGNGETMTAECRDLWMSSHTSPSMNCPVSTGDGCGFYAYKTREQAAVEATATSLETVARVLLWGTVIEYTEGYRAQYLAVDEIYETPGPETVGEVPSFGPGSIVSTTAIVDYNKAIFAAIMNDPTGRLSWSAATCGSSQCEMGCVLGCVRSSPDHVAHFCAEHLTKALAKGRVPL